MLLSSHPSLHASQRRQVPTWSRPRLTTFALPLGQIFNYSNHLTWEFTDARPLRSVAPLWLAYGAPLALFRLLWSGGVPNASAPPPDYVFAVLRAAMFLFSFILEDWAVHELVPSPRRRLIAVLMVASSYVTWTYQTHTFSNAIETIVVLWCLVLVQRILRTKVGQSTGTMEGSEHRS